MRLMQGDAAVAFVNDCARRASRIPPEVEQTVRAIVGRVRSEGDSALREYAERWDGLAPDADVRVTQAAMQTALSQVSAEFGAALREVNIDEDAVLRERYGWDVPVIFLGTRKLAKHRVNVEQLRRQLRDTEQT